MDIKDLIYFLKVAEYENISKAAQELNITQPPLSRQINKLEIELGIDLFIREKGKISLSDAGYFLKVKAQEIINLLESTKEQLKDNYQNKGGKIRIGTIETFSADKLPKWIAMFHKQNRDITYQIVNSNSDEIIRMIDSGLLDLGIVREPINSRNFDKMRLQEEAWVAYIPNTHKLSSVNEDFVELTELINEDLIVPSRGMHEKQITTWFNMLGTEPHVLCWYSSLVNGVSLVKNGLGIMLCPKSSILILDSSAGVIKEIVNPNLTTSSIVVWKDFHGLSQSARKFIEFIRDTEGKEQKV